MSGLGREDAERASVDAEAEAPAETSAEAVGRRAGFRGRGGVSPSARDPIEEWLGVFVRLLGLRGAEAARVRDELEDHLRSRVDDLMIGGVGEGEAVRRAVAELGETAELAKRWRSAVSAGQNRRRVMQGAIGTAAAAALGLSVAGVLQGGRGGAPAVPAAAVSGQVGGQAGAGVGASSRDEARSTELYPLPSRDAREEIWRGHAIDELLVTVLASRSGEDMDAWWERMTVIELGESVMVVAPASVHARVREIVGMLNAEAERVLSARRSAGAAAEEAAASVRRERLGVLRGELESVRAQLAEALREVETRERARREGGAAGGGGFGRRAGGEAGAAEVPSVESFRMRLVVEELRARYERLFELVLEAEYGSADGPKADSLAALSAIGNGARASAARGEAVRSQHTALRDHHAAIIEEMRVMLAAADGEDERRAIERAYEPRLDRFLEAMRQIERQPAR